MQNLTQSFYYFKKRTSHQPMKHLTKLQFMSRSLATPKVLKVIKRLLILLLPLQIILKSTLLLNPCLPNLTLLPIHILLLLQIILLMIQTFMLQPNLTQLLVHMLLPLQIIMTNTHLLIIPLPNLILFLILMIPPLQFTNFRLILHPKVQPTRSQAIHHLRTKSQSPCPIKRLSLDYRMKYSLNSTTFSTI